MSANHALALRIWDVALDFIDAQEFTYFCFPNTEFGVERSVGIVESHRLHRVSIVAKNSSPQGQRVQSQPPGQSHPPPHLIPV